MTHKIIIHLCDHDEALRRAKSLPSIGGELAMDWVNTVPSGFFNSHRHGVLITEDGRVRIVISGYSVPHFVVDLMLEA